jgi:predicted secreted acid phosphatase
MGIDWWFKKMEKFKNVRRKMVSEGDNVEKLVELEMERFYAEDNKEKRMKDREAMIKQETSELRKTYLQAQQFFDTFS